MSILLSAGLVLALISRSEIDGVYLTICGIVLLFQILMFYTVYIGRRP
ncbi:MAG: hypothetical protein RTV41_02310 [Candidatus Thorarchaeota archaeon]